MRSRMSARLNPLESAAEELSCDTRHLSYVCLFERHGRYLVSINHLRGLPIVG